MVIRHNPQKSTESPYLPFVGKYMYCIYIIIIIVIIINKIVIAAGVFREKNSAFTSGFPFIFDIWLVQPLGATLQGSELIVLCFAVHVVLVFHIYD